ncbi:MAG: hypothetical protein AAF591_17075 [Verrucomicrobiota bacterium]
MVKSTFILCLALAAPTAGADESEWKTINHWKTWFEFRVPASFKQDPQIFKGEGHKWVIILNHPDGKFSVSGSPYGYISQIDGESRGFKSARDLFLADEIGVGAQVEREDGYEIYVQHTKSYTQAFFIPANPDWGMSYRWLFFEYPEGQREKYEELIRKITKSYKPSVPEPINAEQDAVE